jgi:hypothetical protein
MQNHKKLSMRVAVVSVTLVGRVMTGCKLRVWTSFKNSLTISACVSRRLILKSPPKSKKVLGLQISLKDERVEIILGKGVLGGIYTQESDKFIRGISSNK